MTGLPNDLGIYDCLVSCDGIEHIGNSELFLRAPIRILIMGNHIVNKF
jgi:hypothetical protein